ncbi:dTDP-4-dehydrorhamnose reductase [Oleisolibacter albus]|uniref:dTDP-4-dehydrorhamnose reductase n=1 Tax=Oleisolibacter albus TaxID=2171757 RepID=UPI000DF1C7B9|nr:dTDP-4-dehydrorhamnose reductase [Oleisolibacter albus]
MPRLFLTGATGQVGSALAAQARSAGWDVTAPGRADLNLESARTGEGLAPLLSGHDLLVNAAAFTKVDLAESQPDAAFAANRDGPAALASAAHALGIPLLHISTDYVFDGTADRPYREEDTVCPLGVYGASKGAGEQAVRAAAPRHVILRTAWVFSAHGQNFLKTMLKLGAERPELRVVADQQGGPTPADDIAACLLRMGTVLLRDQPATTDPRWGTFHFAGSPSTSWHGFAAEIFRQAAADGRRVPLLTPIRTVDYPTPARRPAWSVLDCAKIERLYGIPAPDWHAGIARALEHLPA